MLDILPIFSTIAIVNNVLNICSKLCEFAVTDIFSLPLKYPFNTDSIDTKNIDGARAISANLVSGICR